VPSEPFPHPVRTEWKILALLRRDNPGITYAELGRQLGVSHLTIMHWTRKPLYQSYENWLINATYDNTPLALKRTRAEVKYQLDEFAEEMLERLRDIVETSGDERLIAQIGFDVLDRAGYSEPKRDANRPINVVLTTELLAQLARRAQEAVAAPDLIEATPDCIDVPKVSHA